MPLYDILALGFALAVLVDVAAVHQEAVVPCFFGVWAGAASAQSLSYHLTELMMGFLRLQSLRVLLCDERVWLVG